MGAPWDPTFADRSPLFAPVRAVARAFADHVSFPSPQAIDAALAPLAGVHFVEQAPRSSRARRAPRDPRYMYDARIARDGEVPTRPESWHDLLNALVWASFPRSKRALHARQNRLIVPGAARRTRELDALALFDEGGVILRSGRTTIFGHAIYEGLVEGWPAPLASGLALDEADSDAALEALFADDARFLDPRETLRVRVRVDAEGAEGP